MKRSRLAGAALAAALSLGLAGSALAHEAETAPKPKMTITQITQDAGNASFENTLMIGMIVIMAVTLLNAATGGTGGGGPN